MGACDSDFGNPSPELTQEVDIWRRPKCACARKNRSETLKQHRTSLERRNFYTNIRNRSAEFESSAIVFPTGSTITGVS